MRIIYENEDGGVSVVISAPSTHLTIAEIAEKDVPGNTPFEIVDDSVIPSDRTFRNAWIKSLGMIEVNMPKARIIHMDVIRQSRNVELKKSDKELVRAVEDGIDLTSLKTKRQILRDIPQNFDLSALTTPQELRDSWPPVLPRSSSNP